MSDYLESHLDYVSVLSGGSRADIMAKNETREFIKRIFQRRSALGLPHPACDTALMPTLPESAPGEEFNEVSQLASSI